METCHVIQKKMDETMLHPIPEIAYTLCHNSELHLHFHRPSGRGRTTLPYGAHNALGRLKDAGSTGAAGGAFQQFVAVVHCDLLPLPESERNVKGGGRGRHKPFDGHVLIRVLKRIGV